VRQLVTTRAQVAEQDTDVIDEFNARGRFGVNVLCNDAGSDALRILCVLLWNNLTLLTFSDVGG
jgi:hypothetical protein